MQELTTTNFNPRAEWHDYVMSFYGQDGLYDMSMTSSELSHATILLIEETGEFHGDTVDREKVRDIVYKLREERG